MRRGGPKNRTGSRWCSCERLSERLEASTQQERQRSEAEMIRRVRHALWGDPPGVESARQSSAPVASL